MRGVRILFGETDSSETSTAASRMFHAGLVAHPQSHSSFNLYFISSHFAGFQSDGCAHLVLCFCVCCRVGRGMYLRTRKVYMCGGECGAHFMSSVEFFDILTTSWEVLAGQHGGNYGTVVEIWDKVRNQCLNMNSGLNVLEVLPK